VNIEEMAGSLTGFDEIAIEQSFKRPLTELSETMQARALAFVLARRKGSTDTEAYGYCMRSTLTVIMSLLDTPESEGNDPQPMSESSNTPISLSEQDYRSLSPTG